MKIRLIAIALTMIMILSGFAVFLSYSPINNSVPISSSNNSIPVSPYIVGSNDTLLYEYQINNTGSAFTNGYFPFTFTNESLFHFNITNNVVQNVKFLYSNGTQIKGFIPTGQFGFPNTDQGSGKWLVYLTNFTMTVGQIEDIYMQVFPYTESVLNANFSTSNMYYTGILPAFTDSTFWNIKGQGDYTIYSDSVYVSNVQDDNAYVNITAKESLNSISPNACKIIFELNASVVNQIYGIYSYDVFGTTADNGSGVVVAYDSSTVASSSYVVKQGTTYTDGNDFSGDAISNAMFTDTYKNGVFTFGDQYGLPTVNENIPSLHLGGNLTTSYQSYDNATEYTTASLTLPLVLLPNNTVTQKSIGTVTSITPTSTGNYILFNETGLPYGQSWNVSLTNKTVNVVNSVYASITNTVKAFLPTGYNYSFVFSTFDKSYYKIVNLTGNICLNSKANATVNITLINVSYDVIFHESGLVSGNAWGINFNGTDHNTTSTSLTIIEKNGSYPFTVLISNLYDSNVSSGYANVSGQSLNFYIGFTYHAFNITFSEVGLPSGVKWSMTINGTVYYSNLSRSNTLLFQGKAGSYDGIVNNASYYTPMDKYFNFTITGNAQYTIDYGIILTFIETGYKGLWHITINGVSYSSSTNTIVVTVSPGQVIYNVWGVPGYTISPELVTQTYTSAQTIKITFAVQPASFENVLISTPMIILYFVLAVMTMVGVVYWRLKHEK